MLESSCSSRFVFYTSVMCYYQQVDDQRFKSKHAIHVSPKIARRLTDTQPEKTHICIRIVGMTPGPGPIPSRVARFASM